MELTLNGKTVVAEPREGQSLLELLRDDFGLRSMKDGCAPEGSCGACTVVVDGHAVVSCAQKATRVEGKTVITQEGLSEDERRLWAESFAAVGASQCGFCSPGIVMKAEALLAKTPEPSRDEISHALLGNLCRCTGYAKILDAVELAAATRRGEPPPRGNGGSGVGARAPRYEAQELALGDKPFVADLVEPGMLHGALRFSDHPRARVLHIDTSRAVAHPGVVAVVTAADVPGERTQGTLTRDWRQFVAEDEATSYVGDVLAAVAAESRAAAREAAALVDIEYEVLDPVTDPSEAMVEGAPLLHPGGNVLSVSRVHRGDVGAALAGAAHVVTETFRTQFIEHAFLEPEAALVVPDGEGLRVYSQGQGIWEDRRQIASFLGVAEEHVRVTQVATGGAFGAKEDLNVQCHAALLATATGRPVLLTLSRKESLRFHPKRHPMWLEYTGGCDEDGHLVALRARIVGDTGAYASVGDKVLERAAGHACGAYRVPNVDVDARAVYTNNPPCGAMRGFGVSQSNFAVEGILDRLAAEVGIDGWEIRWRNALRAGDRTGTGQKLGEGVGLEKTLLAVRDAYRSEPYAGIACGLKNTGIGNGVTEYGRAILRPEADGTRHALPLLDGDGPGRPHRPASDRLRGARAPVRAGAHRGGHEARARHRPDDRVTVDGARRQRRGRRRPQAEGRARRKHARGSRGAGVRRRVRGRLDDAERRGRARDAPRLRMGHAGRRPRRGGPAREGDRRSRRRPRDQPHADRRADRGWHPHGARSGSLGGARRRGRRSR